MQNHISPEDIISIKYLLGIIGFFVGTQIALLIFFAKKYIKRADDDHERLIILETKAEPIIKAAQSIPLKNNN